MHKHKIILTAFLTTLSIGTLMSMEESLTPSKPTELREALANVIKRDDIKTLEKLISTRVEISTHGTEKELPMIFAVPDRGYRCLTPGLLVGSLIKDPMDFPKLKNFDYLPAVHLEHIPLFVWAAMRGKINMITFLLNNGANPNTATPGLGGLSALGYAIENGHKEIVDLLLTKGQNINWSLERAVEAEKPKVCEQLIKLGANPDALGKYYKREFDSLMAAQKAESETK